MTEPSYDPGDPTLEDARRKAAWREHMEASAAASTAASMEAHAAVSGRLGAAHQGLFPGATGQQLAAQVARMNARVGDGVGAGRDLVQLGGVDFESQGAGAVAPVPHRADLSQLNSPPGYMRTEHPLRNRNEGRG